MATTTSNYGLVKPDYADLADINVINNNMDKIDNAIHDVAKKSENSLTSQFGSVEGRDITLNSIGGVALLESMDGESEQKTLSGKNLIQDTIEISDIRKSLDVDLSAGTYTLSINSLTSSASDKVCLVDVFGSDLNTSLKQLLFLPSNERKSNTFTVAETIKRINFYSSTNYSESVGYSATYNGVQLELSDTATDFEPYCGAIPSPNPAYPQPINSVGDSGSVEVVSVGKNLFNIKGNVNIQGNTGDQRSGNSVSENILTSGVNTANSHGFGQRIKVNIGDTITFSAKVLEFGSGMGVMIAIYEDNKSVAYKEYATIGGTCHVTYTAKSKEIIVTFRTYAGYNAKFTDIQVEKGDKVTPYEPYQETKATLTLVEPLRSLPNGVKDKLMLNADGTGKVVRRVGHTDFTGNEYWIDIESQNTDNTFYISTNVADKVISKSNYYARSNIATYGNVWGLDYPNKVFNQCMDTAIRMRFSKTFVRNKDEWIAYLKEQYENGTPIYVEYELATPTEEELTAEQVAELLKLRTFEGVTYIKTNDAMQPNMKFKHAKTDVAAINSFNSSKLADINARLKALEG